jgi:hypothetical protein
VCVCVCVCLSAAVMCIGVYAPLKYVSCHPNWIFFFFFLTNQKIRTKNDTSTVLYLAESVAQFSSHCVFAGRLGGVHYAYAGGALQWVGRIALHRQDTMYHVLHKPFDSRNM